MLPAKKNFLNHKSTFVTCVQVFIVAGLLVSLVGCGKGDQPDLGTVSGVVTVDGKPAAGLGILFTQRGFRSSGGCTNEAGEYNLKYLRDTMGAVVGKHEIRIDYLPQEEKKRQRTLPKKYNRESELFRVVESGSNVINFDLQSE